MNTSELSQLKADYHKAINTSRVTVAEQYMNNLRELRKNCTHQPGVEHLTGVGTKVMFCKHCGHLINEVLV